MACRSLLCDKYGVHAGDSSLLQCHAPRSTGVKVLTRIHAVDMLSGRQREVYEVQAHANERGGLVYGCSNKSALGSGAAIAREYQARK